MRDVQKENGNGILKTRGRLTPVEAMADGPVRRGRDGRGHAGRPRPNLGNSSGSFTRLGMTTWHTTNRGPLATTPANLMGRQSRGHYNDICLLMGVITSKYEYIVRCDTRR